MRNQAEVAELAKNALKAVISRQLEAFMILFKDNVRAFMPEPAVFNDIADKLAILFPSSLDVDSANLSFIKSEAITNVPDIDLYNYECSYRDKKINIFIGVSNSDLRDNSLFAFYIQPSTK